MKNRKLKVVWLCYFTNQLVQDRLKTRRKVGDIAPWITSMIPLFENDDSIELHIVSQHEWISGQKHFINKGVNYHFFNKGIPLLGRHWPGFFRFDFWTDYWNIKRHIAIIIRSISPDIIHMHGAENEYCTSIMQFHYKYPVFITIQGFIHKSLNNSNITARKIKRELEIIKLFKHYGYRTHTMGKDIRAINPDAIIHWHRYPSNVMDPISGAMKKFDLVFFARLTKDKGIEDLLKAISIIKKQKPDISLCAIGGGKTEYLQSLACDLGIENNVFWTGFLPTQEDVHKLASTAKISVLPTYHDIISGTIVESLFLKLPVVAYNVGSIHEVNKYDEIIFLVKKCDIKGLAKTILDLLNDAKLQEERAKIGYLRALEMFNTSNDEIRKDLLKAYRAVMEDFHQSISIDK